MHNNVGPVEDFIEIEGTQVTQVMTSQTLGLRANSIKANNVQIIGSGQRFGNARSDGPGDSGDNDSHVLPSWAP
tara:strand:- start:708 stop:929 length:222 start_codon:yes stop_codon:yes gene_type:complete